MTKSAMKGVLATLQSLATTGNGTVLAIPNSIHRHTVLVKGSSGVGAGKIKIETADAPDYAGTWALIGSEVTVVADTELLTTFEGVYPFIRARVSTTVTGGTVSVSYIGS